MMLHLSFRPKNDINRAQFTSPLHHRLTIDQISTKFQANTLKNHLFENIKYHS